jgi:hypothetical protein
MGAEGWLISRLFHVGTTINIRTKNVWNSVLYRVVPAAGGMAGFGGVVDGGAPGRRAAGAALSI